MTTEQEVILDLVLDWVEKNKCYPSLSDLKELGISRDKVRHHFDNLEHLLDIVSQTTEAIFDLKRNEATLPKINMNKNCYVITTAVTNASVHQGFLENIKAYCKKFNAQLLILPSLGVGKEWIIDPILQEEAIITSEVTLNNNLFILGIKNKAATTDPITGLPRIGQRNGTFIAASPKQRLKYVPTGKAKLPHALMSTGAITKPSYIYTSFMIDKNSYIADNDHVMGAVVVEIENEDIFHFRQIQADKDGSFVDLGTFFKNGKSSKMAPEAFVLGDWHSGSTDPVVAKCWETLSNKLEIPTWVMHDVFDGTSVNHHDQGKILTRVKKYNDGKMSLEKELDNFVTDISCILKNRNIVIVKSNHDDFLERYLNEGRYVEDPQNHRISLDLAAAYLDGLTPLEYYFNSKTKVTDNHIIWLGRDESYKIAGIELGAHGDKGANGARGSIRSMENAYGACIYGHTHTAEISREAYCVGTSTYLQLDYNVGASSWTNTSCLVYPNGQRQLINCIEGKSTLRKL